MTTRPAAARRHSAFALAEGFHLAHALMALERRGILASLERPASAGVLARRHGVDPAMLAAALDLLAARTDLLRRRNGRYALTRRCDAYARFVIHQYLGAYGPNAAALDRVLKTPAVAPRLVDRRQHAKAFDGVPSPSSIMIADLIVQLGFNNVLDLGCGTGALLADLSARVPRFRGFGLDVNPAMCRAARKRLAAAGGTIRIFAGNCRRPERVMPAALRDRVDTLTAASLANEFFAGGTDRAVRWLAHLKAVFPGRIMLIADYYGRLGLGGAAPPPAVALHDFVQAISGQGVPPPDLKTWQSIYRAARCRLVHVVQDRARSFFVHLIKL